MSYFCFIVSCSLEVLSTLGGTLYIVPNTIVNEFTIIVIAFIGFMVIMIMIAIALGEAVRLTANK